MVVFSCGRPCHCVFLLFPEDLHLTLPLSANFRKIDIIDIGRLVSACIKVQERRRAYEKYFSLNNSHSPKGREFVGQVPYVLAAWPITCHWKCDPTQVTW